MILQLPLHHLKAAPTFLPGRLFLLVLAVFLLGLVVGHIIWAGEPTAPGIGGDPSSPALPPAGFELLGWYRNVSRALYWLIGIIIAGIVGMLALIADGLSAIQPDIEEGSAPGSRLLRQLFQQKQKRLQVHHNNQTWRPQTGLPRQWNQSFFAK